MITVRVKTKSTEWVTRINATLEKAKKYFLGNTFNVGVFPEEKIERPFSVTEEK
jgi:hypothetical protein